MRDVLEDESRGVRPACVFALAAVVIISAAILYNAFFGQVGANRANLVVPAGATTHIEVDAASGGGKTIQLKYDPVVEEVQRQLLASGYYKGLVDGVTGKRTRQAIESYQQAQGLAATGEPSTDLAEHIRYTREIAEASLFTGTIDADPQAEQRARIRRVQTGLSELAYSPGEISGEMTDETRAAIAQFQHDRGLAVTGETSTELLSELTKLSGQSGMMSN
jgi:peptidoglycan hydrolase-like protein with peptidoglycan-binding domain